MLPHRFSHAQERGDPGHGDEIMPVELVSFHHPPIHHHTPQAAFTHPQACPIPGSASYSEFSPNVRRSSPCVKLARKEVGNFQWRVTSKLSDSRKEAMRSCALTSWKHSSGLSERKREMAVREEE